MLCPHCLNSLAPIQNSSETLGCRNCAGQWHSFEAFRQRLNDDSGFRTLIEASENSNSKGKTCPQCKEKMRLVKTNENSFPLDICLPCQHIWFDFAEYKNFKGKEKANHLGSAFAKFSGKNRSIDINGLRVTAFQVGAFDSFVDPHLLDSPIDSPHVIRGFPIASYTLTAACILVFLKFRTNLVGLWTQYGFIAGWVHFDNLSRLFTSFFVQIGRAHV